MNHTENLVSVERALIIGSPGSGKSTFARGLRNATGLPLYYLDMIWHLPDCTNVPREEFDARLADILKLDRWIIDGNYGRTLKMRLQRADTVFVFDLPADVCLAGALSRIGKKREDLPWVEQTPDPEFLEYIRTFREEKLPELMSILEENGSGKAVHRFTSREQSDACLRTISAAHS